MDKRAEQLRIFMEKAGVSHAAVITTDQIPFDRELRKMCEANRCGAYGKNWACPPLVGSVDELIEKARSFRYAVVFQNIYTIEDSFDIEGMDRAAHQHRELVRRIFESNEMPKDGQMLGAGGCDYCDRCAAMDGEPCRHPGKAFASLEACGVYVSQLAEACGMKYINGVNTITYFGAVLL